MPPAADPAAERREEGLPRPLERGLVAPLDHQEA
jgi:hypothetical protein